MIDLPQVVVRVRRNRPRRASADTSVRADPNPIAEQSVNAVRQALSQGTALEDVAAHDDVAPTPVPARTTAETRVVAARPVEVADARDPENEADETDTGVAPVTDPFNFTGADPNRPQRVTAPPSADAMARATAPNDPVRVVTAESAVRGPDDLDEPSGKPDGAQSPADKRVFDKSVAPGHLSEDQAELDDAQDRGRRRRIAGGVMSGLQMLLTLAGRATNAPGLAALGSVAGLAGRAASGSAEQPLEDAQQRIALRQRNAQADQQGDLAAQRLAFDQEQAERQGKRADRNADLMAGNMLTGQRRADAAENRATEAQRLRADEQASHLDPAHQNAEGRRQLFASRLAAEARRLPTLTEDFADVTENLPNMNADQLDAAMDELKAVATGGGRRGRVGGSGRGLPAVDAEDRASLLQRYADSFGGTAEEAASLFADTRQGMEQLRNTLRTAQTRPRRPGQGTNPATSQVPGWVVETPLSLTNNQLDKARETVATWEALSTYTRQMERLARRASAAQAAGARAGVVGPLLAQAAQVQEQISNSLRTIGGYGVPNGTELERMEALAPRLSTLDGLVNAGNIYPALRRAMWDKTRTTMGRQYGYRYPSAEERAGATEEPQQ